jgi:hypothetical protein
MWRANFLAHGVLAVALLLGLPCAVAGLLGPAFSPLPGFLMLSVLLWEWVGGLVLLKEVARLLPAFQLCPGRVGGYLLAVPAAVLLIAFNSIYSLTTKKIKWRGTEYEMRAPNCIVVQRKEKT